MKFGALNPYYTHAHLREYRK